MSHSLIKQLDGKEIQIIVKEIRTMLNTVYYLHEAGRKILYLALISVHKNLIIWKSAAGGCIAPLLKATEQSQQQ